ncbi:MAG: ATP-dependent DNA helicase RecG [Cytophagales bacterium]|nr:ATP-dependent DNA helicase RecG [Cytophagales bacterium]
MPSFFDTSIDKLKGIGPKRAELLKKELKIFSFGDFLQHYPFRYDDRTKFYRIQELGSDSNYVQLKGKIVSHQLLGEKRKTRLVVKFRDESGEIELIWFAGAKWIEKTLRKDVTYVVFGKPTIFGSRINMAHPEIELLGENKANAPEGFLQPVYHLTDTLRKRGLDNKIIAKAMRELLTQMHPYIIETLPTEICSKYRLIGKYKALLGVHFPINHETLKQAERRLKFEELFFIQLKLFREKKINQNKFSGFVFNKLNTLTTFYRDHLPFDLTNAQKRVIREIREDFLSGRQMNRLLQGDVGSGKTIVSFITALMAIDNHKQVCLMAPTEILATQHYEGLKEFADLLGINIKLLTGSTKTKPRRVIHEELENGSLQLLVGTHALLEDKVQFQNLGLCIIDEQHRFGVEQRSKLWRKNKPIPPHVLVMTATPIPRTLAMTIYGDLDVSVIDELPAGRKPIKTVHKYDASRLAIFGFVRQEIQKGRQAYFVFPLIEESEKFENLKDLMDGYEAISRAFPEYHVSIVHGRAKPEDKEWEMQRFIKNQTQIMVATTVIEVGVNVPNASVMVIENAERFGLAQLHQLRGRVGRGAEQSHCILVTNVKLSKNSKTRMETMVRTNNGFEIADADLKLRGHGDLQGTQQSGTVDLLVADVAFDGPILTEARKVAEAITEKDPNLELPEHEGIRTHILSLKKSTINWGRIS